MLTEMADGDPLASPHAAVALVAALALGPSLGRGGQALLGVLLLLYLQTIAAQHAATQRSRLELHTLRALSHRSAAAVPRHTPHATRHAPRATRHAPHTVVTAAAALCAGGSWSDGTSPRRGSMR